MRTLFCTLAVLVAGYSNAAVMVSGLVEPIQGTDFSSILVTISSDDLPVQTFDFAGDGTDQNPETASGFFGPLSQVTFFGGATVNNNTVAIPGNFDPTLDSRFLIRTQQPNPPAPPVDLPGLVAFESESTSYLQGFYSFAEPRGTSFDIARLVVPTSALGVVSYSGVVVLSSGLEVRVSGMLPDGGGPVIPEPSTLALAGLGLAGVLLRRRVR